MGLMSFRLPAGSPDDSISELNRSAFLGGHDRSPTLTRVSVHNGKLQLDRDHDESGPSVIPWEIPGLGRFMLPTTSLLDRERPYDLVSELSRGKLNQIRNQYADWQSGGLTAIPDVETKLRAATMHFSKALLDVPRPEGDESAMAALGGAITTADAMTRSYIDQVFKLRHARGGKLDLTYGCRVGSPPAKGMDDAYRLTFNTVVIPLTWKRIEPKQSHYDWDAADEVIKWALERGLNVAAGPLLDFGGGGIPDWVVNGDNDPVSLKSLICDYVETVVSRYRGRINRWLIATGVNGPNPMAVTEEDMIRLTALASDAAWQIDSSLQVTFGVTCPFGDYKSSGHYEYSGFVFADTLLRAGIPFAGVEVELLAGASPSGDYCRDLLDTSRQLDLYGLLGVPVGIALGYPASRVADPLTDDGHSPEGIGYWKDFSSYAQADWAGTFTSLAMCKSFVNSLTWDHFADTQPHRVPNGGLVDSKGMLRGAFDRLRELREKHLK